MNHPAMSSLFAIPAALALASQAVLAQPTSPNFEFHNIAVSGMGGPSSSEVGEALYSTLPGPGSGEMASPSFEAAGGFLESNEPAYPDHPVVFGLTPGFGPKEGGTQLEISGVHFDYLGAGPTVMVFVGGVPATGVNVVSDTSLTCWTDAGASGLHDVTVSSTWGQDVVSSAFVSTPAVVAPPFAVNGAPMTLSNYGPPGGHFTTLWALTETYVPAPPFGTLLVGPAFRVLLPSRHYPATDGVHTATLRVPKDPTLDGISMYFQSLATAPGGKAELTNSSAVTFMVPAADGTVDAEPTGW